MRLFSHSFLLSMAVFTQFVFAQEEGSELAMNSQQVVKIDSSLPLTPGNPILIDMGFYGAINAGIFQSFMPSIGLSVRTQKGANGAELDLSILPYNPLDLDAGISYKTSLSYLYHFKSKRSGVYLGGGPGLISNRHAFYPLAVTWIGFQFSSEFPNERRFHGFVDGGITGILEKQVATLVPTVRAGAGFSF